MEIMRKIWVNNSTRAAPYLPKKQLTCFIFFWAFGTASMNPFGQTK
jgi:hypothetical protein